MNAIYNAIWAHVAHTVVDRVQGLDDLKVVGSSPAAANMFHGKLLEYGLLVALNIDGCIQDSTGITSLFFILSQHY